MKARKIEIGKTYQNITVLGVAQNTGKSYKMYDCRCEKCGKIFRKNGQEIFLYQAGGCSECWKTAAKLQRENDAASHIGEMFGNLEIIGYSGLKKMNGKMTPVMVCKCHKCQGETEIPLARLNSGQAKECARCARKNLAKGQKIILDASIDGTMIYSIVDRSKNKNNTSGFNGVSFQKRTGKWRAYINFKRKQYYLGSFTALDDAISARKAAEENIYGDFLKWYAEEYPDQWDKLQKLKSRNKHNDIKK